MVTIHPNPGPPRHVTPKSRAARMERRRESRRTKRIERERVAAEAFAEVEDQLRMKEEAVIVTWNVQGMRLGERTRVKARAVAEVARKESWDVVLLAEVRAKENGVVWMGDEEERVVFVHGERAAVLLRGEALKAWVEGGMLSKVSGRHVLKGVEGCGVNGLIHPAMGGGEGEGD